MKPLDPQRFELAVKCLALHRAKTKVIEQIRADGEKGCHYSSLEINNKREQYFADHMEELIAQALNDVWKLPMFARYRQMQTQSVSQR